MSDSAIPSRCRGRCLLVFLLLLGGVFWLACGRGKDEPSKARETLELDRIPVIDVHAHVFNLRYLPVRGILYRFRVPDPLATEIAELLIERTALYDAPLPETFPEVDLEDLDEAAMRARLEGILVPVQADAEAFGDESEQVFYLSEEAEAQLYEYVADEIQHEQESLARAEMVPESDPVGSDPEDEPILSDFLLAEEGGAETGAAGSVEERVRAIRPFDLLLGVLKKALGVAGAPARFFRMLDVLLRNEGGIVRYLQSTEYPQVDVFVHHMMRLDDVYDTALTVSVDEQIRRSGLLKTGTSGAFPFFVAYDPFQLDPGFTDIERAIAAGATGLKFYPPSGYRPARTIIPDEPNPWFILPSVKQRIREQYASRYDGIKSEAAVSAWSPKISGYADMPPAKALDAINRLAYEKAQEADLVLFSHHTPSGFEAWKRYGREMAAPCYWWDVLREQPRLKLILAHSGGGRGWFGSETRWQGSFARQAFNLCVTFENVYCDFGYLDEVLEGDGPAKLQARLLDLAGIDPVTDGQLAALDYDACVETQLPRKYDIRGKVLYGSDWMMSVAAAGHRRFVDDFSRVFSGDELGPWRDEFFCRNAAEILGLEPSTCDPEPVPR